MRVNAGGVDAVAAACAQQADRPVLVLRFVARCRGALGRGAADRERSAARRCRITGAASSPASRRLPDTPAPCRSRSCGRASCSAPGTAGSYELFKPIARSGVHVVRGRGDRAGLADRVADLVECIVLAARRGERLGRTSPGRGIYFAAAEDLSQVRAWRRDRAGAGGRGRPASSACPSGRCGQPVSGGDVVSRIRRRPGWIGRDKIVRPARGLVDVFVGEGAATAGLVARGAARRSPARDRAVVSRRALAVIDDPGSPCPGAGAPATGQPGRHSARS